MRRISMLIVVLIFSFNLAFSQEPKLILPIGHTYGAISAVFSPDGKRIVTTGVDDNIAKIWDGETGRLLADLIGHTDIVMHANFSPDGKKIITASKDGTAKIWDAVSTVLLADLKGHTGGVYVAEFSSDGKKIVTASDDATAKIWDVASGKLLADLKGHTKGIYWAWFSPDGKKIVTASDDSTAKVWDAATGNLLVDFRKHRSKVLFVEFSPDGRKIITGSGDSTAKIWDAATGNLLNDIKEHNDPVRITHFSPDGRKFVTASDNGDVKLWNAETGDLISTIKGKPIFRVQAGGYFPDIARAADFSPDGKKLLTIYRDSANQLSDAAKIWDAETGKFLLDIKRNIVFVVAAAFSKDGKKIALAPATEDPQIYDVVKGSFLLDLKGSVNTISRADYSSDGKRILISNRFGAAKLLDATTGTLVANLPGVKDSPFGVSGRFSPDAKKVITISSDSIAKLWEATTGTLLWNLIGHKQMIEYAFFSPDGKKVLTASSDSTIKIWDVAKGILLADLKDQNIPFFSFDFSPDGEKMVTSSNDNTAKVWNTVTGTLLTDLKGHTQAVLFASFSPDGKKIVTISADSTAKIWDAETGTLLIDLKGHNNRLMAAQFSPEGKKIVTTTWEGNFKIWNVETGSLLADLEQQVFLSSWQFSKDGEKIVTFSRNGNLKIWNAANGNCLADLKGHSSAGYTVEFSPDGKKIVSSSGDGTAKIWDVETGALLTDLKEHSFRLTSANFSPDGKKIITVSWDRTAKVWDAEIGTSLYTFISINEEDYLVTDKYNHFDGTEAARKLLYFTCGTEAIELEQVKDQLWVPNLAERILKGEPINAAKLSDLNICNLTPLVDTIEQNNLQYRFRITPRLGGLGATILYVNGIEVKRYTAEELRKLNGVYQLVVDKKEVQKFFSSNKENVINVKSLTAKNAISSRSVSINEKGNEKSVAAPNLYAVMIGVSDYKGEELDLRFAAKDAVDIGNAIDLSAKKLLNADGKEHVFVYKINTGSDRDRFPEKNSIRQVFTEISGKAKPNDILLVFFAGHGVMESLPAAQAGERNLFYFLTADASNATLSGALKDVGISTEELSDWIKPQVMKAQKRILIFDACNSGQVIKEMISIGQKGQNFLASRGDDKGKQIKAIEKLNEKSGMFILSASASDQKAYEMGKYNQGALTYSLLKVIKEEPDILEDRQYLNISRWFNAAEKSVGELARETGARQQPQIVSTTNFNIGVVDEEVRNKIILPFEKPMLTRSDLRNADLRIDNLKLRSLVDKELDDISGNSAANIMYNPEYDGADVYTISGDYSVSGNDVTVSVILTKGGTEIKTRFETKGLIDQLNKLAASITVKVIEWLGKGE